MAGSYVDQFQILTLKALNFYFEKSTLSSLQLASSELEIYFRAGPETARGRCISEI
jgi:hypothetical protein